MDAGRWVDASPFSGWAFDVGSVPGLIFGLLTFLVGVLAVVLGIVFASISPVLVVAVIVVAILGIFAISLVASALTGIYTAGLYRYATKGDAGAFDTDTLAAAFRTRAGGVKGLFGRSG